MVPIYRPLQIKTYTMVRLGIITGKSISDADLLAKRCLTMYQVHMYSITHLLAHFQTVLEMRKLYKPKVFRLDLILLASLYTMLMYLFKREKIIIGTGMSGKLHNVLIVQVLVE